MPASHTMTKGLIKQGEASSSGPTYAAHLLQDASSQDSLGSGWLPRADGGQGNGVRTSSIPTSCSLDPTHLSVHTLPLSPWGCPGVKPNRSCCHLLHPSTPSGDAPETNSTWEQSQGTDTPDAGCWWAAVPKGPFESQGSPVLETNTTAILLQMGLLGKKGNSHEI